MNMNSKNMAIMGMATLMMASCGTAHKTQKEEDNTGDSRQVMHEPGQMDPGYLILTDEQRDVITKNNDFALRFFRHFSGFDSKVVSPLSVSYLMGMLANGANGTTRNEIMKAVGLEGLSATDINDLCLIISNMATHSDPSTAIKIANYIAMNKNYPLKDSYTHLVKDKYQAGVESLDFSNAKTAQHINDWCKKQTGGMIPSIIDNVNASDISYLMNAVYFKGTWTDKFDKKDTRLENFRGYTRDIKKVQMMHRNDDYQYTINDMFAAVEMPYGNRSFRMTVLLPNEGKSIDEMMKSLTAQQLAELNYKMYKYVVDLKLPRFTTEVSESLNDVISKMGAPSMFNAGKADFSNMSDDGIFVSKMIQKAKIEVNEEGTKAAAVTAAIMTMSAMTPDEPRHAVFHADRPFVYVISEASTGAIFFIGQFTGE